MILHGSSINQLSMHTKAVAFFPIVFSLVVMAASVSAENLVQVTPEFVDFGQVEQGEIASARFQLRNTGTRALSIQWMQFSKPGLIAQVNPQIGVGSSVEVLVNWNTDNLLGDLEGQIILGLNDPQNTEIVLTLSGTVIPAIEVILEPEIPVGGGVRD